MRWGSVLMLEIAGWVASGALVALLGSLTPGTIVALVVAGATLPLLFAGYVAVRDSRRRR